MFVLCIVQNLNVNLNFLWSNLELLAGESKAFLSSICIPFPALRWHFKLAFAYIPVVAASSLLPAAETCCLVPHLQKVNQSNQNTSVRFARVTRLAGWLDARQGETMMRLLKEIKVRLVYIVIYSVGTTNMIPGALCPISLSNGMFRVPDSILK